MKRHLATFFCGIATVAGPSLLGTGDPALARPQSPKTDSAKPAATTQDQPGADAFPKLSAMDRQKLTRLLEALKTKNDQDRQAREAEIVALGRGVIPSLIETAHLKHKLQEPSLVSALDKLTGAEDFPLVRGLLKDPAPALRIFALTKLPKLRAGKEGSPSQESEKDLAELFVPVLQDADPEVKLVAALTLADQHRPEGLLILIEALKSGDSAKVAKVQKALPSLKGKEAYKLVEGEMHGKAKDPERRLLLLGALGQIGDPASGPLIAESLAETSSRLQEATVNALRRVIDGAEPLEFATVFDLVKEIETWKQRLGQK